ncbi:MAG: thymidine phosphorylase [Chloroflexi bacterium]|nr:thymidine phosphorylase [Chloroflexota bacterium]
MHAVDIIIKKRDGGELTRQEIEFFVMGVVHGEIPDYQAAAWLMAIVLRGMSKRETVDLTEVMARSGDVLDLSDVAPMVVDKHSTGGVGDKVSLVVAPMVAACGLPVGKMSGRGLSFSGGTLDKLESIPGLNVHLTIEQFKRQLATIGIVIAGQTADLAPADGILYALRDVTGTVESLPLIASSVMSKKIAAGANAIVLDVKAGRGAFMKTVQDAVALAKVMVEIGEGVGRKVRAAISDMNQPLGNAVGNALEVAEAIATLRGYGPEDLTEHCLTIAAHMLILGGLTDDEAQARTRLEEAVRSGAALEKFRQMVEAQHGDPAVVDHPEIMPRASIVRSVAAPQDGWVKALDAMEVGLAAVGLGAGREKKGQPIDHAVGFLFHKKIGDRVKSGEPLFTVHANSEAAYQVASEWVLRAYEFSATEVPAPPLFYEIIK